MLYHQVWDAQCDSEAAIWTDSGVLLSDMWSLPENSDTASGGPGKTHQTHRRSQRGERGGGTY